MTFKVTFTTGATRHPQKIVDGATTVKDFLAQYGGHVGTLMFGPNTLGTADENRTFAELANTYNVADGGEITLFDAPKTANA